jgi:hypothetical protein
MGATQEDPEASGKRAVGSRRLKRPGTSDSASHLRRPGAWAPEKGPWCAGVGKFPRKCEARRGAPRPSRALSSRGPLLGPVTPLAAVARDLEGNSSCGSQRFGWELGRKSNLQLLAVWAEEWALGLSQQKLTKVLSLSAGESEYLSLRSLWRVLYSGCPQTWLPC